MFTPAALTPTLPLQIAERIGEAVIDEQFAPGERLKVGRRWLTLPGVRSMTAADPVEPRRSLVLASRRKRPMNRAKNSPGR